MEMTEKQAVDLKINENTVCCDMEIQEKDTYEDNTDRDMENIDQQTSEVNSCESNSNSCQEIPMQQVYETKPSANTGSNMTIEAQVSDMDSSLALDSQPQKTSKSSKCDVEIIFHNKEDAGRYKARVECYFKILLTKGETFSIHCDDKDSDESQSEGEPFRIDSTPKSDEPRRKRTPIYTSPFTPLSESKGENEKDGKNSTPQFMRRISNMRCFNCLGNHHIYECPEERNAQRIAQNKKDLNEEKSLTPQTPGRYHEIDQFGFDTSKYSPGVISEELREAMGLKSHQLPLYIYSMRLLGYPPGWLMEAQVESSGITLIDTCGKVDEDSTQNKLQYDANKFIRFPGFNCSPPYGTVDEWRKYNFIPMQNHQQLSEALKHDLVTFDASLTLTQREKWKLNKKKKHRYNPIENPADSSPNPAHSSPNPSSEKSPEHVTEGKEQESPSVSILHGTPVVETGNPFKGLPDANKFAAGISEHIHYENLPDAVGTFEKMRDVLQNVRHKLEKS